MIYIFSLNILLSSSLLFLVQPLIAKMLLPLYGGGSYIWLATMLFFQIMVLAGYSYTHLIAKKLSLKNQLKIHSLVSAISIAFLPLSLKLTDKFYGWFDEVFSLILLLIFSIGIITLVLSSNSILVQSWAAKTLQNKNPYKLYIASNFGSLAALFAYPIFFETLIGIKAQSQIWTAIYIFFISISALQIFYIWQSNKESKINEETLNEITPPKSKDRVWWVILSLVPSSLLYATTNHITIDIGAVPLFWILPLAVYLISFIFAFSDKQPLNEFATKYLGIASIIIIAFISFSIQFPPLIILHLIFLLLALTVCHSRLYSLRPDKKYLTEFYIYVALGGFLGGFISTVIFPNILNDIYEYVALVIVVCLLKPRNEAEKNFRVTVSKKFLKDFAIFIMLFFMVLVFYKDPEGTRFVRSMTEGISSYKDLVTGRGEILPRDKMIFVSFYIIISIIGFIFYNKREIFIPLLIVLFVTGLNFKMPSQSRILESKRNYYGVMKVIHDKESNIHMLRHGSTLHGFQILDERYRLFLVSYYGTPMTSVLRALDRENRNIAVAGLGVGTTACLADEGGLVTFFEIDEDVVHISANPNNFTYLRNCPSRKKIIIGDARLKLAKQEDKKYDLVIIDVFSSDYIPVHMFTEEAVKMYLSKINEGGLVLVHLSNRYFGLTQPFANIVNEIGVPGAYKFHRAKSGAETSSIWAAISNEPEKINELKQRYGWNNMPEHDGNRTWTDDYYNLLSSLKIMN